MTGYEARPRTGIRPSYLPTTGVDGLHHKCPSWNAIARPQDGPTALCINPCLWLTYVTCWYYFEVLYDTIHPWHHSWKISNTYNTFIQRSETANLEHRKLLHFFVWPMLNPWQNYGYRSPSRHSVSRQSPSRFHGADVQLDGMPPSRHATEPIFLAKLVILLIVVLQRVILQSPRLENYDGCFWLEFTNKT